LDGIDPKVVVLMIGTNNSGRDSAEQMPTGSKTWLLNMKKGVPCAHYSHGCFSARRKSRAMGPPESGGSYSIISSLDDGNQVSYLDIARN